MAKPQIGLCTAWDICHLIYLTPMKLSAIAERLGRSTEHKALRKMMERLNVVLKAGEIKLLTVDEKTPKRYYIHDPFWRDKLEMVYCEDRV